MAVIEVRNLAKRYGQQVALDGVSFTVEQGEIFGILGPNGAGKTTAVECMAGLRRPDSGSIRVLGLDPQADGQALRERVGVQLQETHLQDKIKVWEALDLYASFYRRPADWNRLLETWGLAGKRNALVSKLSGGQRQRLFIALALVAARPGVPGRADLGAGPAGPPPHLGPGQADQGRRSHRRARVPLHGRGRGAVRPGRDL